MNIYKINLKNDFIAIVKQYFKFLENLNPSFQYNVQIKDKNDFNELCLLYYNLLNRFVESKPRKVHKSKILYCPFRFKIILNEIENKIESGEDITPYLSRGIKFIYDMNIKRNIHRDVLLDLWGIHHIHLGSQIKTNGFIKRSGPILFIKFDNKNAYFLLIKRHGRVGKEKI
ncbi:MAG: hypothetical protein ACTSRH_11005 [Promethearchaeota archaeon]